MQIKINIYPDPMPLEPALFSQAITDLMGRIEVYLLDATITKHQAAIGDRTLLDHKGNIIATIDIFKDRCSSKSER